MRILWVQDTTRKMCRNKYCREGALEGKKKELKTTYIVNEKITSRKRVHNFSLFAQNPFVNPQEREKAG